MDPPREPRAPRPPVVSGPASRGWRSIVNEIEWMLYDLRRRFWRWVEVEDAMFVGGPLSGQVHTVPRDAKEWIIPQRDGEYRYLRKRRVSGTYFMFDRRAG